jgi:GT2 family glycosyltransferase
VVLSADYLRDAGIFDPTFFLYYEDFDLAWRGRQLGWIYRYEPAVSVLHEHAYSSKAGSAFFNFWVNRNRRLTLVKNAPTSVAVRAVSGFYGAPVKRVLVHMLARLRRLRPPSPTVVKQELRQIWSFTSALPSALRARRVMRRRRVVDDVAIERWMLTK